MDRYIYFSLLFLLMVLSCISGDKIFKENTGKFAELEVKIINGNKYYLSINFNNSTIDTIGIYCIGNAIQKGNENSNLDGLLYDTIIEIKQNGNVIKSNEIKFTQVSLSERIHQLILVKPQSVFNFPIFYRGNIVKDFNLDDSSFLIRVILKPQQRRPTDQGTRRAQILYKDSHIPYLLAGLGTTGAFNPGRYCLSA